MSTPLSALVSSLSTTLTSSEGENRHTQTTGAKAPERHVLGIELVENNGVIGGAHGC